jgi:hypothetical protein
MQSMLQQTLHLSGFRKSVSRARRAGYLSARQRTGCTVLARWRAPTRKPVIRRIMNDVADGLLLDVRDLSLSDLEFADANSALSQALERILMSKPDCNFNSFNSSIS